MIPFAESLSTFFTLNLSPFDSIPRRRPGYFPRCSPRPAIPFASYLEPTTGFKSSPPKCIRLPRIGPRLLSTTWPLPAGRSIWPA